MIYFDSNAVEGWSIEDVEKIRNSALKMVNRNMHPRYDLVIKDLFKASNALLNEMKLDESRTGSTNDGMGLKLHTPKEQAEKPFFSAIYEETKPETYQGIHVIFEGKEEVFNSGDFESDLLNAQIKYPEPLYSSTVHSYIRESESN